MGVFHRGQRQGPDTAEADRFGRGPQLRGKRGKDRGSAHAARIHAQYNKPVGRERFGDSDVG